MDRPTAIPVIAYWCGGPVLDLSREELVEALSVLAREIEGMRSRHKSELDFCSALFESERERRCHPS